MKRQHHLHLLRERHARGEHIANVNEVHDEYKQSLGFNGKVATILTAVYGSMYFVYFLVFGSAGWILIQEMLGHQAFDPLPFALLLLVGNFIQLFGGPIIQVGQNLSSSHSELRAESDHHIHQVNHTQLEQMADLLASIEREQSEQRVLLQQLVIRPKEGQLLKEAWEQVKRQITEYSKGEAHD